METTTTNKTRPHRPSDYVTWRAGWRLEYAQLSSNIRELKREMKEDQRAGNGYSSLQATLIRRRREAASMMEERTRIDAYRRTLARAMNGLAALESDSPYLKAA